MRKVGFRDTFYILLGPYVHMHFSAEHNLHTMQQAVAPLVGSVDPVTTYQELEAATRHQRCKLLQFVVGTVPWDADIVVRGDNNSITIELSEMRELDDDDVSEDVVQILRMAHKMSVFTPTMLSLERKCTRRQWRVGTYNLSPYVASALEVSSGVRPPYVHLFK